MIRRHDADVDNWDYKNQSWAARDDLVQGVSGLKVLDSLLWTNARSVAAIEKTEETEALGSQQWHPKSLAFVLVTARSHPVPKDRSRERWLGGRQWYPTSGSSDHSHSPP